MNKPVRTVLIASGSGTDADAIMQAWKIGAIPEIDIVALISTKAGAGCLDKAKAAGVPTVIIDKKEKNVFGHCFDPILSMELKRLKAELVFLVGCVAKIKSVPGIAMYNIHPADTCQFGGKGMYGLEVHKRVLADVLDKIGRGKKNPVDRFFTYPTVHEAVTDYDSGAPLLRCSVQIPFSFIQDLVAKSINLEEGAMLLQQVVLKYEWAMLPAAVKMAALKITERKSVSIVV